MTGPASFVPDRIHTMGALVATGAFGCHENRPVDEAGTHCEAAGPSIDAIRGSPTRTLRPELGPCESA